MAGRGRQKYATDDKQRAPTDVTVSFNYSAQMETFLHKKGKFA